MLDGGVVVLATIFLLDALRRNRGAASAITESASVEDGRAVS